MKSKKDLIKELNKIAGFGVKGNKPKSKKCHICNSVFQTEEDYIAHKIEHGERPVGISDEKIQEVRNKKGLEMEFIS